MAMGLPRPSALTAALLAPPTDALAPGVARALRDRVARELGALADGVPCGEQLRVDVAKVMLALRHPDRCLSDDSRPFAPSARACRRAVGLAAVARCARGLARTPGVAVNEVLDAGVEDVARHDPAGAIRSPWWATWYAQLPVGGRAAVKAEAVTWATQLLTAFEWRRFDRPPAIAGRDDWWQAPGGRLALRGRADVRAQLGERAALVVVGGRSCDGDWKIRLGFPALVCLLARGERALPCRVVGVWPASGQTRVLDVDSPALEAVAKAVVSATETWIGASARETRAARAG